MSEHEPHVCSDSEPPGSDEDEALARIEALLREQVQSLDRMLEIVAAHPPPFREPAPSAPPG
ncbi:hypothetical protein [Sorangium sp. So ce233]|uniref:hypothetical protein n=1 Tax=Sorangium sp. So ce233 TaxID=3133290 RepID=UPI003F5DE0D0